MALQARSTQMDPRDFIDADAMYEARFERDETNDDFDSGWEDDGGWEDDEDGDPEEDGPDHGRLWYDTSAELY
jgi:hypothetical protein